MVRGKKIPLDIILKDTAKTYKETERMRKKNIYWANISEKIYFKAKMQDQI